MSGKRTIVGYRVRLKGGNLDGIYVAHFEKFNAWGFVSAPPKPTPREEAATMFKKVKAWRVRREDALIVWSAENLRLVRVVVRKGGGK